MLKGLGQLGDLAKIMSQAKEMKEKMAEVQAALDETIVEGQAAGGKLRICTNAKGLVQSVSIDPELIVPGEAAALEQLVLDAMRDAQTRAAAIAAAEMGKITEGLNLPAGMTLPG